METNPPQHPTEQVLSAYGLGRLDDSAAESVYRHLESCSACRRRVADLSSDSFLGGLRDAPVDTKTPSPMVSMERPVSHQAEQPDQRETSTAGWSQLEANRSDRSPLGPTLEPSTADSLPPALRDHSDYEVLGKLGEGGLGIVYLARNKLMGREEVLKVVRNERTSSREVLERFLREIRSAAQLHHTNIVTAFSVLRAGESVVFAMEYVEGYDLAKLVKTQGRLPIRLACNFVYQAALGLQCADEKGMVHRDIKPNNLMVARHGKRPVVKVLDFGLAKATREVSMDGTLTREGQMLGTPYYMAPEQIVNAQKADIRADIYSLGCTLYYLLTGNPPFDGTSLYDIFQAHMSMDALALNLVRPEVPAELAALVAKMMAKEPDRRFQTPGEVARALKPFFKESQSEPRRSNQDLSQAAQLQAIDGSEGNGSAPAAAHAYALVETPMARETVTPGRTQSLAEHRFDQTRNERASHSILKTLPIRRKPWFWPAVAAGVLLLGLLAGIVIRVKTPDGVLVLEGLPSGAEVYVDGSRVTVKWPDGGAQAEVHVRPGEHLVELRMDGFRAVGESVTIDSGNRRTLTARLEPFSAPKHRDENDANVGHELAPPPPDITSPPPRITSVAPGTTTSVPVDTIEKPAKHELSARATAEAESHPQDWVPLFNGADLTGWKQSPFGPVRWIVRDGAIQTSSNGRLYTQRGDYTNFHLRTDLKAEANCLGGVFFRSAISDHGEDTYAVIINTLTTPSKEPKTGSVVRMVHSTGATIVLQAVDSVFVKPQEWFTLELIVVGNHFVVKLNEKQAAAVDDPSNARAPAAT